MSDFFTGDTFFLAGRTQKAIKENIRSIIEKLGGKLATTIDDDVTYVIVGSASTNDANVRKARSKNIPILLRDYILDSEESVSKLDTKQYTVQPEAPMDTSTVRARPVRAAAAAAAARLSKGDDGLSNDDTESDVMVVRTVKPANKAKDDKKDDKKDEKAVIVKKGKASVDNLCPVCSTTHIYQELNGYIWKAVLNQTQIDHNNNKYYYIQLLESDTVANQYYVWNRWGRVGYNGQNKLMNFTDLDSAKHEFSQKFLAKTSQDWQGQHPTPPYKMIKGKYYPLDICESDDDSDSEKDTPAPPHTPLPIPESKLPKSVQSLVEFIADQKAMIDTISQFEVDVKKFPLGKLSKALIKQAYEVLTKLEDVISHNPGKTSTINDLTAQFYTLIPTPVGMHAIPPIKSLVEIKSKMKLLETLGDIQIAQQVLKTSSQAEGNPLDSIYEAMHCKLTPIPDTDPQWDLINKYVQNTHGKTHSTYSLKLLDLFEIEREGEKERFAPFADNKNRMLLWHGSRRANWVGIITQGLRIAPPEAPPTGYMFGKGVYFADMSSKSANYCHADTSGQVGIMMLCEVALGDMYELTDSMYMEKPQAGTLSTWGKGRTYPDPSMTETLPDGCKVPLGTQVDDDAIDTTLQYNEFIVYDVAQIRARYILKLHFNKRSRM